MKTKIYIGQETMETLGDGSLTGILMYNLANKGFSLSDVTEVELVFKQTSLNWRKKNGGPEYWIMPEFSVMCLMEGILWLNKQGITVTIEEEIIEDAE